MDDHAREFRRPAAGPRTLPALLLVAAVLLALGITAVLFARRAQHAAVVGRPAGTANAPTGPVSSAAALTALAAPPVPRGGPTSGYNGCPAEGDGGDRQLNVRKNRADSVAFAPVRFAVVRTLPVPDGALRNRQNWDAATAAAVARYEGRPVQVEGYLAGVKNEGPESPNCHGADADRRDWHLWLSDVPGPERAASVVVETTPPVRARHPGWTLAALRAAARVGAPARVSGWLLLDEEHPEQIGRTRGTLWEVHPVLALDVQRGGRWVPLDAAATGGAPRRR